MQAEVHSEDNPNLACEWRSVEASTRTAWQWRAVARDTVCCTIKTVGVALCSQTPFLLPMCVYVMLIVKG